MKTQVFNPYLPSYEYIPDEGTVTTDEKGLAEVTGFKGEYHRNVSQGKRFLRCFSGQGEALA